MPDTDVTFKPVVQQQLVDVLGGHKGAFALKVVAPRDLIMPDGINVPTRAVHDQAAPVGVHEQKSGVGLLQFWTPNSKNVSLRPERRWMSHWMMPSSPHWLNTENSTSEKPLIDSTLSHPPSQLPADQSALLGLDNAVQTFCPKGDCAQKSHVCPILAAEHPPRSRSRGLSVVQDKGNLHLDATRSHLTLVVCHEVPATGVVEPLMSDQDA